jgi:magnesium transporter
VTFGRIEGDMPESFFKRRLKTLGLPPGSLVYTGDSQVKESIITMIHYDETAYEETTHKTLDECKPYLRGGGVVWINIVGLGDTGLMENVRSLFKIHPLLLEDILNMDQRPTIHEQEGNILVILKMLTMERDEESINSEQVSILFRDRFVITFQERPGDVFENVRERIRKASGRIRTMGNDYLAYALIDAIVDNYFTILERFGDGINALEEEIRERPAVETSHTIGALKRELLRVRRAIWPLREVLHTMARGEFASIKKSTEIFIRDVYDHTIQIIDAVETLRDLGSSLYDSYLSSISFQMNKIMSVLTIIATIFIPLTFIAGVYGMNFQFMPELKFRFAYPLVLGIMAAIGGSMLFLFKRKRWL